MSARRSLAGGTRERGERHAPSQTHTLLSLEQLASRPPLALHATALHSESWPSSVLTHSHSPDVGLAPGEAGVRSQIETVLSNDASARDAPPGENWSERTVREWPGRAGERGHAASQRQPWRVKARGHRHAPVEMDPWKSNLAALPLPANENRRTVLSVEHDASRRSVGDHVTVQARSEWPALRGGSAEGESGGRGERPQRLSAGVLDGGLRRARGLSWPEGGERGRDDAPGREATSSSGCGGLGVRTLDSPSTIMVCREAGCGQGGAGREGMAG